MLPIVIKCVLGIFVTSVIINYNSTRYIIKFQLSITALSTIHRTLPMLESPYPILVLVGPQGVGKKSLAQKLVEELSDYFGYA